ncbi:MAG: DMT family transporter [bacterium]
MFSNRLGHLLALFTIFVWGTTFISTKMLLHYLTPIEILFFRFSLAFIALCIFSPQQKIHISLNREELYFAGAGLAGITLYFLFENIALVYSYASNVSIILCMAPFFTALFAHFFLKTERLKPSFFIGFLAAISGIALINFNSSTVLQLNPLGDILALLAAAVWAVYSILIKKISLLNYSTVLCTKKTFLYGLIFMLPCLPFFDFKLSSFDVHNLPLLLHISYLGLGASALCFATWNFSVKLLGAVKTSIYIYLTPVITIIFSAWFLAEKITPIALIGTALTMIGLFISERA